MKDVSRMIFACLAVILLICPAFSQTQNGPSSHPPPTALPMSEVPLLSKARRAAIAKELIAKWQSAADSRPGGGGKRWATMIAEVITSADASSVLRAWDTTSLEGLHAALAGDARVGQALPRAIGNGGVTPQVLGSSIADTTYTPLPNGRCRVADSRVINSPIPAGGTRQLWIEAKASYLDQGGNGTYQNGDGSTACGLPRLATAYAVSVTLLSPAAAGVFKVYGSGSPFQAGNSILFNAGSFGANGDLIVRTCQGCTYELAIQSSASVHYVIDVIGYFIPPQATPIQCYQSFSAYLPLAAGGTGDVVAPACVSGYVPMSTQCEANAWPVYFPVFGQGRCAGYNNSSGAINIRASSVCCRVPGR